MLALEPPKSPLEPATAESIEAADHALRFWKSTDTGPLTPGSDAHKREVCRMFRETFNPYRPSVIDWPKLNPEERRRVTSLPIWDIAVHTEGRARLRFAAYAKSVSDPDVRAAIMLNAWEENRHKEVLAKLVEAYDIRLAKEPAFEVPRDPEWVYLLTGFSECIDSFFAFGLFELARRSGFFPVELVDTFEPVVQEECRHILLFANWLAWHRANLPWWWRIYFELRVVAVWIAIARERIGLAFSLDKGDASKQADSNFTASSASAMSADGIGVRDLLGLSLEENDRRFAGYDARLVRPTTMPTLAKFALFITKPWARKKAASRNRPKG
ncbi:MAG: ferritin-like domain-containing protein [Proteobacteria bacterium]|nr:ferritin-like domain-containing protein [Pseudomonadota bacterium]